MQKLSSSDYQSIVSGKGETVSTLSNAVIEKDDPQNESYREKTLIYGGVASSAGLIRASSASLTTAETDKTRWSLALQTLLDQPPAALPQRLMIAAMAFCLAFGAWAWFGKVEEIGQARGKLVPEGETYKIQPIELGKVNKIVVKEGEAVKAGQTLVELDTELIQKEVERLEQLLDAYQIELGQKQGLLGRMRLEDQSLRAYAAAETQAQRLALAQEKEKVATLQQLSAQLRSEAAAYQARQTRLEPLSARSQQLLAQLEDDSKAHQVRLERLKPLEQQGAVSVEYIFQAEKEMHQTQMQITQSQLHEIANTSEQLFQSQQSLREIKTRMTQSQGDLIAAVKEIERLEAELAQKQAQESRTHLESQQQIQQLEVDLTQLEAKKAETQNLLVSTQAKLRQSLLKAPIDGIISSLNLHNPGEAVQPGQTIAEIAPYKAPLVLWAVLPNREAGFVKEGMSVQIKLDAYPYQDYGIIPGQVKSISSDSKVDEHLGAVYQVEVILARDHVTQAQQNIKFKAGQTATADIIIRRRRIADILLEPIRQLQKDGISL